ncbi:MAG: aldo/keto reductase [Pseudomonadota bacterium]
MTRSADLLATDVRLPGSIMMPRIGLGTWRMGESASAAEDEVNALRHAHDLGFRHFDTAEMYGEGGSERILGRALASIPRGDAFLTSKFYPYHADRAGMASACEASLERLGTDYLDLYLLHWPGSVPLEETLEGARDLLGRGLIRSFGISNFDARAIDQMHKDGQSDQIAVNQVLYNPARRGIEFDLLPNLQDTGIACVAYTPLEPSRLATVQGFVALARELGLSPAQLAFAWQVQRGKTCPIPKSATLTNIKALVDALASPLDDATMAAIDAVCPPPSTAQPLEIL